MRRKVSPNSPTPALDYKSGLINALNKASAILQKSMQSEEEVYHSFQEVIPDLGLRGGIARLDETGSKLIFKAYAHPKRIRTFLTRIEKLTGYQAIGYTVNISDVDTYQKVIENVESVYKPDGSILVELLIPKQVKSFVGEIMNVLGSVPVIFTPLITSGKASGILHIAGDGLSQDDIPAFEAFANHVSIALSNAALFSSLRESEASYKTLIETSPDAVTTTDLDGVITFASPYTAVLHGFSDPNEMVGKPALDFVAQEYHQKAYDLTQITLKEGIVRNVEYTLLRQNGDRFDAEVNVALIRDIGGNPKAFIATTRDVTERVKAEAKLRKSEEKYRDLFENVSDFLYTHDLEGNFIETNRAFQLKSGYSRDEMSKMNVKDLIRPRYLPQFAEYLGKLEKNGKAEGLMSVVTKDKGVRIVEYKSSMIYVDNDPVGVRGSARDITDRLIAQKSLIESEEKYRTLVDNINIGVYRSTGGQTGKFLHANSAIATMFGFDTVEEFMKVSVSDLYQDPIERKRFVDEIMRFGYVRDKELQLKKRDGTPIWASVTATVQFDEKGEIIWMDGVIEDITDRKRAEEQLLHDAFHDHLTNLPNRSLFLDRLERNIERSKRNAEHFFAVLFMDLDRFKVINDSLGHAIGDQLLIACAERLNSCVRSLDTVARFGGDEFVILLEDIEDIRYATQSASRIQNALKAPFYLDGHEVYTTASTGIVFCQSQYDQPENVLRDADIAMYRAKTLGKDRYELFDTTMLESAVERLKLETELRRALEEQEFRIYYQPVVTCETGTIVGFEALLRWRHPDRGLLFPDDFLKIAEETGIIIPIDDWVLSEVCYQMKKWRKAYPIDPPLWVSVNLSRKQFADPLLPKHIMEKLNKSGLDPNSLKVEITEEVVMEDIDHSTKQISELHDLGIKIQMDDFGTGYSSLGKLADFPIDTMKVDRYFVGKMKAGDGNIGIIKTIMTLARDLGMNVIAEGVETTEEYSQLRDLNCDYYQGFFFSKPVDDETAKLLIQKEYQQRR